MEIKQAIEALEEEGFKVHSISKCLGGNHHYSFDVTLTESSKELQRYIARFEADAGTVSGKRIDAVYGGAMSLEREIALCQLVREGAGLPAPNMKGPYHRQNPFILAEFVPGKLWAEHLQQQNYSRQAYLLSLELLGKDVGRAHKVTFEVFGDVMGKSVANGVIDFSTRLEQIVQKNLQNNGDKYNKTERKQAEDYFASALKRIEKYTKEEKPRLIFADLHTNNHMVDAVGKPSGYFDLEFCQAGVPAMEMYNVSLQFFALFNLELFAEARNAFLKGYKTNGLEYDPEDQKNKQVELLLAANHFFRAATTYKKFTEGPRAGWADEFKEIFFDIVRSERIDYIRFKKIIRPKFPDQPSVP